MKLLETNDEAVNWTNTKPTDSAESYDWAMQKRKAAHHEYTHLMTKMEPYYKHLVRANHENKFNTPIIPDTAVKIGYYTYAIPVGTPNADQLWKVVEYLGNRATKARKAISKYNRLAGQLKKQYRGDTFNDLKYKVKHEQIPSTEIPRRIYYLKDRYFNNPYWDRENVEKRYAGPVGHFPNLSNQERVTLAELERVLKRHGLPGMTKAYGVVLKNGKREWNYFVAFGSNDRLIWKREQNNTVYIDGQKVSISNLTGNSGKSLQYKVLAPLKEPKP